MKKLYIILALVVSAFVCTGQTTYPLTNITQDGDLELTFELYNSGWFVVTDPTVNHSESLLLKSSQIVWLDNWVEIRLGEMTISLVYNNDCTQISNIEIRDNGEVIYKN